MDILKLEKDIIASFDEKGWLNETEYEIMLHLTEEIGEISKSLREKDKDNFQKEIADSFFLLIKLCHSNGFSIQDAVLKKLKEIKNDKKYNF